MVVEVNELVEVITKMVCKECSKRNIYVDEDIFHDVFVKVWSFVKRNHGELRETWTGYVWRVVNSVLNNLLRERYMRSRIVYLEDIIRRGEDDDEGRVDECLIDQNEESFSVKLIRVLEKYQGIGDDFLRLLIGDLDVSNAFRSLSQSRKRNVEWIEWWLCRKLSEEERACCKEIEALLS
jgi:hypothetical protein